ncbi:MULTISPECIES: hypothetical protein [Pseudomonas]|uniref:hypothetical protein n=1 Tax=Pseudomonas TaxID=286 RepID=UPI000CD4E658|nr:MULTISPECIES: hypothetical protein [Pseudomonas]RBH53624.1 hypothetical protein C3F00_026720 [Pseudomonas sp. MWU13-2860]
MASTLKKYQTNPKNLLETAIAFYRSKKIKTAVVEGTCDRRFLQQWTKFDAPIRFDGFDGKDLVLKAYDGAQTGAFLKHDFLYFFSDIDFDEITGENIVEHPKYINNAYCSTTKKVEYNDLEIFLINTAALEKVLVNHDIEASEANVIRDRLESTSRLAGSFRAADILVTKKNGLRRSILNGLEPSAYFNSKTITLDRDALLDQMPRWANHPNYLDELIDEADTMASSAVSPWSLSRGHDVTEFLALHLTARTKYQIARERLELMLRLACELDEYKNSPMGRKLLASKEDCFLK